MTQTDGTPIWFELITDDPEGAAAFYDAVVGWRTQPSPVAEHGGYRIAQAPDGDGIAGIMAPMQPGRSGWAIYFLARDLDGTLARVATLGGTTRVGPMDIPHVGRFAVIHDPSGIAATLLQPLGEDAARPFKPGPDALGHAVWTELATPDPDGAFAFYGALFGWTRAGGMPMGAMGEYAFLGAGEARPGAIMSSTLTGAPARWNVYFLVPDIDAALAQAARLGGTTLQGPDPIPGGDFSANILDAQGNQVGLVGARAGAGA